MVLSFYGKHVPLEEVRQVLGIGRDGATAQSLLRTGKWFGLDGRGLRIDVEDLATLSPGTILHWKFKHFVVFERQCRNGVQVVDPNIGRMIVPMSDLRQSLTGIAIELEPDRSFTPTEPLRNPLWRHFRPVLERRCTLVQVITMSLLVQFLALGVPLLTNMLVDRIAPEGNYDLMTVLGTGLLAMTGFHLFSTLIRAHLLSYLRNTLDSVMTVGFMQHLVRLPYTFFQGRSTGDLLMRANSNAMLREVLTSSSLSAVLDGLVAVTYLGLILRMNLITGALAVGFCLMQVLVVVGLRQRSRDLVSRQLSAQGETQTYLAQMINGMETIKASGAEQQSLEHWSQLFRTELASTLARVRMTASTDAVMGGLRTATPLVILYIGGLQVLNGQMSLGTMLALQSLVGGFLGPIGTLISVLLHLQTAGGYIDRLNDVLDAPVEQESSSVQEVRQLEGNVSVHKVSFRYSAIAPMVLQDVTLEIKAGQMVGIVGRSGSGKSTLGKLLLGLYRPMGGDIRYDGVSLANLDLGAVRRQMGVVLQPPFLFGGSILSNLTLADPHIPFEEVVAAASLAHIHSDIVAMPMGYETVLSDGGASLSGGQRQRIALARALVNRPAILLMDEATSALDTVTEAKVQEALASIKCTRIVIAQRLSTVRYADLILVLEQGRITERGTHAELMELGGAYAQMVSAQIS